MAKKRVNYTPAFKAKVAIAAIKGDKTLSELAAKFDVHPTVISRWKSQLLDGSEDIFQDGRKKEDSTQVDTEQLFAKIGKLEVALDFLKKKSEMLP